MAKQPPMDIIRGIKMNIDMERKTALLIDFWKLASEV
jgi:hypothetical protein